MVDVITTFAALMSISILSIPFKESRFSRVGEFIYVGLIGGITLWANIESLWSTNFLPLLAGDPVRLFATIGGIIILLRPWVKQLRGIALIPLALAFGYQIGTTIGGAIIATIWKQALSTIKMDIGTPIEAITSIIILVIVVAVLLSFMTTFENRYLGWISQFGRWMLIIAFAAGFGTWMIGRFGLLSARMQYLLYTWLGIAPLY